MARSKQSTKTKTAEKPAKAAAAPVVVETTSKAVATTKKTAKAAAEAQVAKVVSKTPYQLDEAQVTKAVRALQKWLSTQQSTTDGKPNLLAADDSAANAVNLWLVLTTKKYIVDERKLKPVRIPLPHPLLTAAATGAAPTVCLIVKDPQRHYKDIVALSPSLSSTVTRVIGISKLRTKFKAFEAKRQLYDTHDVFLADDRIVTMLPKTLGNAFYKKTAKVPVPVTLDGKDSPAQVEKEIKKALSSTYLHLQPAASTSIRVAMSSFTPEEATENVVAAMKELTEKRIPGGWRNLKSVHIKTPESAALPVWATPDLYTEEDVLKPEEAEEQKKIEEEKAAERAERKKAKIQSKKRKGLSETEPVADEEERSPKKAKSEVEAPKVIETKEPEVEAEAESEEEDNGMEVLVPGDVESSEDEEEVVEEAPKKSLKTKKSAETLKRKKSVDEVKSAAKKTKAASSKGVKAKKPKKA